MPTDPDDGETAKRGGTDPPGYGKSKHYSLRIKPKVGDVLSVRIYLTNFKRDYEIMNETYKSYFCDDKLRAHLHWCYWFSS